MNHLFCADKFFFLFLFSSNNFCTWAINEQEDTPSHRRVSDNNKCDGTLIDADS